MKLFMQLQQHSYDIIIKRGSLANVGRFTDLAFRRVLVVTDSGTPAEYAKTVLSQCREGSLFVCPAGEAGKTLAVYEKLASQMQKLRFSPQDLLVAVGGGAVADLVGFAAATCAGGMEYVLCPTTTLAQLGCTVGGHAGLNSAKDGAPGAFSLVWHPCLAVLDPDLLATLPPRQYAAGLAEAVRAGLLRDPELFALLESGKAAAEIETIIYHTLRVKKVFLEKEESCNTGYIAPELGQPLTAAVQRLRGIRGRRTTGLLYGECLALGILGAVEDNALRQRVRALYRGFGLPLHAGCESARIRMELSHLPCPRSGMPVVRVTGLGGWQVELVPAEQLDTLVGRAGKKPAEPKPE